MSLFRNPQVHPYRESLVTIDEEGVYHVIVMSPEQRAVRVRPVEDDYEMTVQAVPLVEGMSRFSPGEGGETNMSVLRFRRTCRKGVCPALQKQ